VFDSGDVELAAFKQVFARSRRHAVPYELVLADGGTDSSWRLSHGGALNQPGDSRPNNAPEHVPCATERQVLRRVRYGQPRLQSRSARYVGSSELDHGYAGRDPVTAVEWRSEFHSGIRQTSARLRSAEGETGVVCAGSMDDCTAHAEPRTQIRLP